MVTMAKSTLNWCNTHTHVGRTHSLTHLHQHSYNHIMPPQLLQNLNSNFWGRRHLREGEQTVVPRENPQQPAH